MKNFQPLISIIVPCYNQARYLSEALESVLVQTYSCWECIIVNDGSTDNTEEVSRKWLSQDGRFKYIYKKNGGLSSARNAGLELAAGEYIQLLDADDLLEINKIGHQMAFLSTVEKTAHVLVSGYRYFQDSDTSRELLIFGPYNLLPEVAVLSEDKKDLIKLFARTNPMVVCAPLYHKTVFQRIGRFDENLGALEDWDFHFRCVVDGVVFQHSGYLPESKVLIRLHGHSMSANRRNMMRHLRSLQQKHKDNYVFAVENELIETDIKKSGYRIIKMLVPPILIWLVKKIMGMV